MVFENYDKEVKIIAQRTITRYEVIYKNDGILYCNVSNEIEWTPQDFKLLFPAIGEMTNFKKVPVLITYKENSFPSTEASVHWADPEKNCPYFICEAHVMDSLPLKVLGNFYLNFRKPNRETKFFNNTKEALAWLKTFL